MPFDLCGLVQPMGCIPEIVENLASCLLKVVAKTNPSLVAAASSC